MLTIVFRVDKNAVFSINEGIPRDDKNIKFVAILKFILAEKKSEKNNGPDSKYVC